MEQYRIFIGDTDETYAKALTGFILTGHKNWFVRIETTPETITLDEHYDAALLTEAFLPLFQDEATEANETRLLLLCESVKDVYANAKEEESVPRIHKFQPLDRIVDRVKALLENEPADEERDTRGQTRMIGIYAPVQHPLQLPFALLYGQAFAEKEKTLLLDMEETSILPELVHRTSARTIVDYLYLTACHEKGRGKGGISDYLEYYGALAYLPPVENPSEISFITGRQWGMLLEEIEKTDFSRVILLFDRIHQGFSDMVLKCEELILLGQRDAYYERSERKVVRYLESYGLSSITKKVLLPRTICTFPDGDYPLEELEQSDLKRMAFAEAG